MTPVQIKFATYGGVLLLLWLLRPKAAPTARVTKTIEVEADVYNPNFGLTDAEIAAQKNPAVDPVMRELIDRSNRLLAEDDVAGDNQ